MAFVWQFQFLWCLFDNRYYEKLQYEYHIFIVFNASIAAVTLCYNGFQIHVEKVFALLRFYEENIDCTVWQQWQQ